MAKACAYKGCGARKAHPIHGSFMKDGHPFMDASSPGLKPMSEGMRNFRQYSGYDEAVKSAKGSPCQVVSPVCTGTAEHLHEPLTRGRAGGLARAYDIGGGIPSCDACNGYIGENPVWAAEHGFLFSATVEGEQAAREAKEARNLSQTADVRKDSGASFQPEEPREWDRGGPPNVQPREKRRRLT